MRLRHNERVVIDIGHTGFSVILSWDSCHFQVSILDKEHMDVNVHAQGLNLAPIPAPLLPKSKLEQNAERLAELLDYVGHGGYEERATSSGERVNVTCAHCGSADHLELICHSLNPLRVTIDPDYSSEVKDFENMDVLRERLEEIMGGY